jgi:hypothetical protein
MEFDTMWEKIKKGLKDGAALSMEKIEEYTRIGKLKIEELGAKRKIERNFHDIGERAFDLIAEGRGTAIDQDLAVKKAVENIKQLKDEIVAILAKIKAVADEAKADKEPEDEITGV